MRALASFLGLLVALGLPSLAHTQEPPKDDDRREEGPPPKGYAPDPKPLASKKQWKLAFVYREGKTELFRVEPVELDKPRTTPRVMGRFAVELFVGEELIERVRFDFPLLGADEWAGRKRPREAPPSFEKKLTTRATVMVPHSERATRVRLVDRATGEVTELPWPFEKADAGQ